MGQIGTLRTQRRRFATRLGNAVIGAYLVLVLPACYDPEVKSECGPPDCLVLSDDQVPPDLEVVKLAEPNSYDCRCSCGIDENGNGALDPEEEVTVVRHELQVCMLDDHNRNLGGEYALSDLTNDCRSRVRQNLQAIGQACVAADYLCRNCEALAVATPVASCNRLDQAPEVPGVQPCEAVPLQVDQFTKQCINFDPQNANQADFKSVTHHPNVGDEPVCLADREDPPVPTASPLGAGIFGRTSTCNVSGKATLIHGERNADGVVHFTGEPCPGGGCDVGMFFTLAVEPFEVTGGGFLGVDFGKAEFTDMRGWGSSIVGGATLNASGVGEFSPGELLSTGQGTANKFACDPITHEACVEIGTNRDTVLARNDGPLGVTVQWGASQPWCALNGTVSTLGDGFAVDMTGDIVNQPPRANAGADQVVECTGPAETTVALDGAGSTDLDNNIKLFSWRQDGRAGEQIAWRSSANVSLGLGESRTYVLTVVDAFGQASHDSMVAAVADTTAPSVVSCNAPATIAPSDGLDEDNPAKAPVTFTATADDTCDPSPSVRIISFDCYRMQDSRRIDKKASCAISIDGATITILNGGGIGTRIQWIVSASDDSDNVQHKACEVEVRR